MRKIDRKIHRALLQNHLFEMDALLSPQVPMNWLSRLNQLTRFGEQKKKKKEEAESSDSFLDVS